MFVTDFGFRTVHNLARLKGNTVNLEKSLFRSCPRNCNPQASLDALVNILKPLFLDEREGVNMEGARRPASIQQVVRAFG